MHDLIIPAVLLLLLGTRSVVLRRRDAPRPGDPRTAVRPLDESHVQLVVTNPARRVLLVSAGCRRPRHDRRNAAAVTRRSARRRERLRTVDTFLGTVTGNGAECWTLEVPSGPVQLDVVLSLSADRVRFHRHPLTPEFSLEKEVDLSPEVPYSEHTFDSSN